MVVKMKQKKTPDKPLRIYPNKHAPFTEILAKIEDFKAHPELYTCDTPDKCPVCESATETKGTFCYCPECAWQKHFGQIVQGD